MLREYEKKVCKRRLSINEYFNLEGEKKSWKSTSVHVQRLKFLVWKPRLGSASNSYNRKFSSYSPAKVCLFQTFCIISSVLFPFKLLLVSLPTLPYPPPNNKSISPGLWCGLHYMSVCIVKPYVLQQQVIGREERRREEFISVQLFSMPRIKKKPSRSFCSTQ